MKDFKLDEHVKIKNGFNVPDSYFSKLSEKIEFRLDSKIPRVIPFYAKRSNWIYSAAAILVVCIGILRYDNFFPYPFANQNEGNFNSHSSPSNNFSKDSSNEDENDPNLDENAIEDILEENPNLEHIIMTM